MMGMRFGRLRIGLDIRGIIDWEIILDGGNRCKNGCGLLLSEISNVLYNEMKRTMSLYFVANNKTCRRSIDLTSELHWFPTTYSSPF
jgi:hypothetical protein